MKSCVKRCSPASESSTGSTGQHIEVLKENMEVLLERQRLIERCVYDDEKHTKESISERQFIHKLILSLFGRGQIQLDSIHEVSVPGTSYKSRFHIMDYLAAMRARFHELRLQMNLNASDIILSEKKAAAICRLDSDSIHLFVVVQLEATAQNNEDVMYRLSFTSDLLCIFSAIVTALEKFDDEDHIGEVAHV